MVGWGTLVVALDVFGAELLSALVSCHRLRANIGDLDIEAGGHSCLELLSGSLLVALSIADTGVPQVISVQLRLVFLSVSVLLRIYVS